MTISLIKFTMLLFNLILAFTLHGCLSEKSIKDIANTLPKENKEYLYVSASKILQELHECRHQNKNLNDTIDDILEEISSMKDYIIRNEEKITQVSSSVSLLSHDVDNLSEDVSVVADNVDTLAAELTRVSDELAVVNSSLSASVKKNSDQISAVNSTLSLSVENNAEGIFVLSEDVLSLTSSLQDQELQVWENIQRLDQLSIKGIWCGVKGSQKKKPNSVINYDSISFSDTNINVTKSPLNIITGQY